MIKKLLLILSFLWSIAYSQSGQNIDVQRAVIRSNLVIPLDTIRSPTFLNEIRYRVQDNAFYVATSLTGPKRWTAQAIPAIGSPILPSDDFPGLTNSQRTTPDGNTVVDLIDANSRQYFTATKRVTWLGAPITDGMVDNVMFFKHGTDYYMRDIANNTIQAVWWGSTNLSTNWDRIMAASDSGYVISLAGTGWTASAPLEITKKITIDGHNNKIQASTNQMWTIFSLDDISHVTIENVQLDLNLMSYNGIRMQDISDVQISNVWAYNQYKRGNGLSGTFYGTNVERIKLSNLKAWNVINSDTTANSHSPFIKMVTGRDVTIENVWCDSVGVGINLVDIEHTSIKNPQLNRLKDNGYYLQGAGLKDLKSEGGYMNGVEEGIVFTTGSWEYDAQVVISGLSISGATNRGVTLRKGRGLRIIACSFYGNNNDIAQSNSYDGVWDLLVSTCIFSNNLTKNPVYINKAKHVTFVDNISINHTDDSTTAFIFTNSVDVLAFGNRAVDTGVGNLRSLIQINIVDSGKFFGNTVKGNWGDAYWFVGSNTHIDLDHNGVRTTDSVMFNINKSINNLTEGAEFNFSGGGVFKFGMNAFFPFEIYRNMGLANASLFHFMGDYIASSGRSTMMLYDPTLNLGGTAYWRGISMRPYVGSLGSGGLQYIRLARRTSIDTAANATDILDFQTDTGNAYIRNALGIGILAIDASAALQINSTTKAFYKPRMTNTQMLAISLPLVGAEVFNTTDSSDYVYQGLTTGWQRKLTPTNQIRIASSSSGTFTVLGGSTDYIFEGTTSTWTWMPLEGFRYREYYVRNAGSGNLTINSATGGNDFLTTAATNTFVIPSQGWARIVNDNSTRWIVYLQ